MLAGALPDATESSAPAGVRNEAQELLERGKRTENGEATDDDNLRAETPAHPGQPKDAGEKIEHTFSS